MLRKAFVLCVAMSPFNTHLQLNGNTGGDEVMEIGFSSVIDPHFQLIHHSVVYKSYENLIES